MRLTIELIRGEQKGPLVSTKDATADVDSIWKNMNQPVWKPPVAAEAEPTTTTTIASGMKSSEENISKSDTTTATSTEDLVGTPEKPVMKNGQPHITITRTYDFAGAMHHETKLVPLDSAEAKLFLASQSTPSSTTPTTTSTAAGAKPPLRRPLKRTSQFDTAPAASAPKKVAKINTLEKSKMDWAGYVDREGINEELDKARKGAGYLDRQAFLSSSEQKRDQLLKEAKKGGR